MIARLVRSPRRALVAGAVSLLGLVLALGTTAPARATRLAPRPAAPAFVGDCEAGAFAAPVSTTVGSMPVGIAAGDFDGDGALDVASANVFDDSVSILLGDGSGALAPGTPLTGETSAVSVATGDLNRDGALDLVVARPASNGIAVRLGHGDGTFDAATPRSVGVPPVSVAVADLSGDGILDVATANFADGSVTVLLGDGTGGFDASTTYPAATGIATGSGQVAAVFVTTGDLDRDGDLDLVVGFDGASNIATLLNDGSGTFGAAAFFPTGTSPISVALADLDRDGDLDAATANVADGSVSFLPGDGAGGFGAATTFVAPETLAAIAAADVNGTGTLDLVATSIMSGTVFVFPGDGTGAFGTPAPFATGGESGALLAADLDRDGRPDLVSGDAGGASTTSVSVLLNVCPPCPLGFRPSTAFAATTAPVGVATGDFDRDGDADLAVGGQSPNRIAILRGNGAGGFGSPTTIALSATPLEVETADLDGDGDLDLVVGQDGATSIAVLLNDGSGVFGAPATVPTGAAPGFVALADLDRDGDVDIATSNIGSSSVSILLGNGNGTFAAPVTVGVGTQPSGIVAADFDGDGDLDLATANRGSTNVSLLFNNGAGVFGGLVNTPAPGSAGDVVAGDFDHDGDVDLFVSQIATSNASYLAGDGAGGFAAPVTVPFSAAFVVHEADVDGDGSLDVVGPSLTLSDAVVVLGDGGGGFGAPLFLPTGSASLGAAVADFDRDGGLDVVTTNANIGSVSVVLQLGCVVPCELTCPADVTVPNDPGQCGAVVNFPAPATTGDCAPVVCTPASGTFFVTGTHTVVCTAGAPPRGSGPTCVFNVTVLDAEAPTISCPADVETKSDPEQCGAVVTYAVPSVSDNCAGASVTCEPASGSFFAVGATTVTCTATDLSPDSQDTTCSFTVTVTDGQAPAISCPTDVVANNDPGQCGAVVSFTAPTASDNCSIAMVACSPVSGSTFPLGTTTVTCTATDEAGNASNCSFTVTVVDGQAPSIACPPSVATGNTTGLCGAVVSYAAPVVSDNCSGVTVVCTPTSGSVFPVGTSTVTCTARDAAGNTSGCSFAVTVTDTEAPSIVCPGNLTAAADTIEGDQIGAIVMFAAPVVTDNCPGSGVPACTPPSGSFFPVGVTTVTCAVSDAAGNPTSCTFTVTVTSAFTNCYVDDASGDTLSIVADAASPLYGVWRYHVAATGEVLTGTAEHLVYYPMRSLAAYDHDTVAVRMDLNVSYSTRTATATVTNMSTGGRYVLRDRNTANDPPCAF